MHPLRILAAATAIEIVIGALVLALGGLAGARSGWLDVINNFAPMLVVIGLLGAGFAWAILEPASGRIAFTCVGLLASACAFLLIVPELKRIGSHPARPEDGQEFTVLTANVLVSNATPDDAARALAATGADAVLVQEADGTLEPALRALAVHYPHSSRCEGSDVRIFVRRPIEDQGCGLKADGRTLPKFAWVRTTDRTGREVVIATVHFTWPFPPRTQDFDRRALQAAVAALPADHLILTGDFNTTPWSFGMRDQDARLKPLTRRTIAAFSWPARLISLGSDWALPVLPIDHVYAGPGWSTKRIERVRIPGSDHFAILATLRRRDPG